MANYYYSGQGRLYVGERDTVTGLPVYLSELGNSPKLEISVEITKFEHKESQTGSRAVDKTIVQEKKGTFAMTLESLTMENLALAFWGSSTSIAAATTGTAVVVLTSDKRTAASTGGVHKRLPLGDLKQGLTITGVTGAAAANLSTMFGEGPTHANSKCGYYDSANGMLVVYDAATITANSGTTIANTDSITVAYSAVGAYSKLSAFSQTSSTRYLRFEGLNTIDQKKVIVDIFKADLDPLSGYGLINEELGSFELTGSILLDDTRAEGNQFFQQINIA